MTHHIGQWKHSLAILFLASNALWLACEPKQSNVSLTQSSDGSTTLRWYHVPVRVADADLKVSQVEEIQLENQEALLWQEEGDYSSLKTYYTWLDELDEEQPRIQLADYRIWLKSVVIDPLNGRQEEAYTGDSLCEEQIGIGLHILQFKTPVMAEHRRILQQYGIELVQSIPSQAVLVRADAEQLKALQQQGHVYRSLAFQKSWKLASALKHVDFDPDSLKRFAVFPSGKDLLYSLYDVMNQEALGQDIEVDPILEVIRITTTLRALSEWLQRPEILWVEPLVDQIEFDMDNARLQGGADAVERQLARHPAEFTGLGIRGHVLEGIDPSHPDFAANKFRTAPVAIDNSESSSHGHMTYGIIFGSGEGNHKARGVLPNAQGFYTNYADLYLQEPEDQSLTSRYGLVERLVRDHQVMFQTASWGHSATTDYNIRSMELDKIIFDWDLPITQSQSNYGTQLSRPQAWAKNVISVGAIHHFESADPTDDRWDPGWGGRASIGPAKDGRIKPDLVAYFDSTETVKEGGGYTQFGGTSGATPIVAGYLGLVTEMWVSGVLGNSLTYPKDQNFANRPPASMAKALLIHSAEQYEFSGLNDDMSRFHQGWGFPDLRLLMRARKRMQLYPETNPLKLGESFQTDYVVESSDQQLDVTLVYTDPPPAPVSGRSLVNDMDLKVTAPDGTVYRGNFGLIEGMSSRPSTGPEENDTINPIERVIIYNPFPGRWTIEVIAREVATDSHPLTEALDADFSLVISAI